MQSAANHTTGNQGIRCESANEAGRIIPIPPTIVDYTSTNSFFAMLHETLGVLAEQGFPVNLRWIRMLATRTDEGKSIQQEIIGLMRTVFGDTMLRTAMKNSAEIDNASARIMTVYDLDGPVTSRDTYNRCITQLNAVNTEVELLIRMTWPSQAARLRSEEVL